jgi:hypothetical protein
MEVELRSEIALLRRYAAQACLPGWYLESTPDGFSAGPLGASPAWVSAGVSGAMPSCMDAHTTVLEPLGAGWLCVRFAHPHDLSPLDADELHEFVAALVDRLAARAPRLCHGRPRPARRPWASGRRR